MLLYLAMFFLSWLFLCIEYVFSELEFIPSVLLSISQYLRNTSFQFLTELNAPISPVEISCNNDILQWCVYRFILLIAARKCADDLLVTEMGKCFKELSYIRLVVTNRRISLIYSFWGNSIFIRKSQLIATWRLFKSLTTEQSPPHISAFPFLSCDMCDR